MTGANAGPRGEKTLSAEPVIIKTFVLFQSSSILYWYEIDMRPKRAAYVGNIHVALYCKKCKFVVTCPSMTIGQMQLISLVT